ncbi:MAG: T9SS type A sorting domain-containing protein [Bacteroidetes bacterium]|nr:T9SS type A sorting domain-containing protein [Bacteroidota bacterium]
MNFYYCIFFVILAISSNGQTKRSNNWITGYSGNRICFNSTTINTFQGIYFPFKYFTAGNSCLSDSNGNLVLASDGYNVYDSLGDFIEEGDTLAALNIYNYQNGWCSESQGSIFLPIDSNKYYFITPSYSDTQFNDCLTNNNCYLDLMLYNVIDMNANGGLGKVTKSMQPILQNARLRKTQMMACKHGNGKDWWLLKNEGDSANVHTFLFTQDSVYDKGVQVFNEPVWGGWDIRGQSTFNSDGSKYATTSHGSSTGLIFIADFDRCHGLLSNPYVLQMPWGSQHNPSDTNIKERLSVGLCFSPNNQFLYVISMSNVYQYDLLDNTWVHIEGLDTSYIEFQYYETAYLAPDNKIYIGNWGGLSKQMSRIDNPDVKGAGCNFCPRCLRLDSLGANAYVGTPPCMPNYGLGAKTCWPLNQSESGEPKAKDWSVYPNPAFQTIFIKNAKGKKKILFDVSGRIIYSTIKDEIDVSQYAKGMYLVKIESVMKKVIIE